MRRRVGVCDEHRWLLGSPRLLRGHYHACSRMDVPQYPDTQRGILNASSSLRLDAHLQQGILGWSYNDDGWSKPRVL